MFNSMEASKSKSVLVQVTYNTQSVYKKIPPSSPSLVAGAGSSMCWAAVGRVESESLGV